MKSSFLQSDQWENFQKALGRKVWRLEQILVIRHDLPFNKNYLYCPRGLITQQFLEEVKKIAQQEKSIFFKIEPEGFEDLKSFVKSAKQIQPQKTLVLDITKSEEELLNQMHQKTRYNIRLAQRKGVRIQLSKELNPFFELLEQTAKRDKFHLHPRKYYQKMLEVLGKPCTFSGKKVQGKEEMIKLFIAKYQDKIIGGILVCFFDQTATYLHGAADYNFRQLMASHLCQWQAICQAKRLGFQYYDFWGIDEQKWPGVTRFKKGFNGKEVNHPGAFDLVFQPGWYRVYNLARQIL